MGQIAGKSGWGWRTVTLAAMVLLALVMLTHQAAEPARAQPGGQGVFTLDKAEYETVEGQAVFVTVKRTDGGILTEPIDVQLALTPGAHPGSGTGFDWPPSDEVKLVTFPAGSNLSEKSVYIQTLNQNHYSSRTIHVTIRSISNGGLMGPIWTAPIHLDGNNQPQILTLNPKAGDEWSADGTTLTLTGRNFDTPFTTVGSVLFTNIPGTNSQLSPLFFDVTPTSLRVRVPDSLNDYTAVGDPLAATYHVIVNVVLKSDASPAGQSRPTNADLFVRTSGPTVRSVSPDEGPAAGFTVVHITGTKFNGVAGTQCSALGTTVEFRDVVTLSLDEAETCEFTGTNTIRVTTPQRSSGLTHVIVTNPGGESPPTVDAEYLYDQGPIVTSISPSYGPPDGGTIVTIFGSSFGGLIPGGKIRFGGVEFPVQDCQQPNLDRACWISPTELRVMSPNDGGVAGIRQITVVHPVSGESPFTTAANFTYSTGPLIQSITPAFGPVTGGTVVTIRGTGFAAGATVRFGTTQATFATVKSQTEIEVTSPPGTGNQMIRVTSNGVTSPDTPLAVFAYSGPIITSISPIAGPIAGGTVVTIKGENFTNLATVQFGTLNATPTFVDTQTLTVTSPAHAIGEAVHIRVTTGSGVSPETPASLFTYTNGPIIDSLNPAGGPTTGGTVVIITGKNFLEPLSVSFGTTPAPSFNINSATQITVLSPSHGEAEAVDVRVTRGADTSPVGEATKFTYSKAVPIITSLTPNSGSTFGGYDVVITGLGFTGATCPGSVKFGAVPAATCTVINDTTLSAKAPPNVAGETVVAVTTPNGTSAIQVNFTYVSPSSGGGGTAPPPPSQIGTETYTLTSRWTLMTWAGVDNHPVNNALGGVGVSSGFDITHRVTAIYEWDALAQEWKAYFPGAVGIPGATDFSAFKRGGIYWVAINGEGTLNWVVPAPQTP